MKRNLAKVLLPLGVPLLLFTGVGAVACKPDTVEVAEYEDCDLEDQAGYEDDCGYWQRGGEVRLGHRPDATWVWIWYTWVIVGQNSRPPVGWTPPRGITPPVKIVTKPRSKVCALAPAFQRPAPAPAPKNNPPKNNPPKNNLPPQPGGRPAGC